MLKSLTPQRCHIYDLICCNILIYLLFNILNVKVFYSQSPGTVCCLYLGYKYEVAQVHLSSITMHKMKFSNELSTQKRRLLTYTDIKTQIKSFISNLPGVQRSIIYDCTVYWTLVVVKFQHQLLNAIFITTSCLKLFLRASHIMRHLNFTKYCCVSDETKIKHSGHAKKFSNRLFGGRNGVHTRTWDPV